MSYLTGGRGRPRWPVMLIMAGIVLGFWTGVAAVVWWLT